MFFFVFFKYLAARAAKYCKKKAVIQSAASAASAQGGCASSRLDHGLKFYVVRGGCASSRLIHGFSDCVKILEVLWYHTRKQGPAQNTGHPLRAKSWNAASNKSPLDPSCPDLGHPAIQLFTLGRTKLVVYPHIGKN